LNDDYLKYWRVIRQYIKSKYGLTQSELDVILFLKSEGYFSKDKFDEFDSVLSWDIDRFEKLKKAGWIQKFRNRVGKSRALYMLSSKAKNVTNLIYRKISGEEIATSPSSNPMFLKNVSYTDKVYRHAIIKMNASIRRQRHRAPE